jgi:4'-phosphopantetheinyl transferase
LATEPAAVDLGVDRIAVLATRAHEAGPQWLSPSERARLERIGTPRRRHEFIAGRWLARELLATVHGTAPAAWSLSAEPSAPPRVQHPGLVVPVHVALSHSGPWVACAVAAQPVGLDIEAPSRSRDVESLAELVCTPAERLRLQALEPAQRPPAFYRLWTLKEAWLKRGCDAATPHRLAALHAREAQGLPADARVWQHSGVTLALVAPADAAVRWHGDAAFLQDRAPELWRVDDRGEPADSR